MRTKNGNIVQPGMLLADGTGLYEVADIDLRRMIVELTEIAIDDNGHYYLTDVRRYLKPNELQKMTEA